MKNHQLERSQFIKSDINTVWNFFSSPKNLERITPLDMNFKILDIGGQEEIYKGQLINYKVSPFPFLRVSWTTEITGVEPKSFFEDSQKKGPFKQWIHRHYFSPKDGGVLMVDVVNYAVPLGLIGSAVNQLMVRDRVFEIFDYRRKQIELIFP